MTDNKEPDHTLIIPAFQKSKESHLVLNNTREAERRLLEAKDVNPVTYAELESCFNEAYREIRRHMATLGYEITRADSAMETAKSTFLIDTYPELIKDRPKSMDSADLRKAYLMRDANYVAALDRIAILKAMEALLDGKIKVFEKTCQFMRKKMDLILRSGLSDPKLYYKRDGK